MKNIGDLQRMAREMQANMEKAQTELGSLTVEGTAGGGAVTVLMTGTQEAREIRISKDAVDPEDVETLQDLVLAALNDALGKSKELAAQKLGGVCAADDRDHELVCVVEEPLDVLAIERTGQYKGVYHVLHGAISPVNGVRPDDLKIAQLVSRIKAGGVGELILATNPNLEGE